MKIPDYDVPFKRDGLVSNPDVFKQIVQGVPASEVQTLIGDPLGKTSGSQGPEWNYNFTLLLPRSENYMVCQYKVVFDGKETVKETVWRRPQCLNIVNGTQAMPGNYRSSRPPASGRRQIGRASGGKRLCQYV